MASWLNLKGCFIMKKFFNSLSEDDKLVLRGLASFVRTILAFCLIKLTFVLTDSHLVFAYLSEIGINGDLISFALYVLCILVGSTIGVIGVFAITPLGWLIVAGLTVQDCTIIYRPIKKLFHSMKKIFLW